MGAFVFDARFFDGAVHSAGAFFELVPFEFFFSRNCVKSFAVAFFGKIGVAVFFAMGVLCTGGCCRKNQSFEKMFSFMHAARSYALARTQCNSNPSKRAAAAWG